MTSSNKEVTAYTNSHVINLVGCEWIESHLFLVFKASTLPLTLGPNTSVCKECCLFTGCIQNTSSKSLLHLGPVSLLRLSYASHVRQTGAASSKVFLVPWEEHRGVCGSPLIIWQRTAWEDDWHVGRKETHHDHFKDGARGEHDHGSDTICNLSLWAALTWHWKWGPRRNQLTSFSLVLQINGLLTNTW